MENKELIQNVINHLLYLEGKNKELFIQEIELACEHYKVDRVINYDLSKFKIPLHKAL